MKKIMLMLVLLHAALYVAAQRQSEYNRQGDAAMKRFDYSAAKIWYEENISSCDTHSIDQLTSIWLADESMRMSMRAVMSRCLDCLTNRATEYNDTTSMNKLIQYYTEGIGTDKNQTKVDFWKNRLTFFRNASSIAYEKTGKPSREKMKMKFFAGYSGSYYAPYGLTVGGVGRFGWYLRYRTNFSFQNYTGDSKDNTLIGISNNLLSGSTGRTKTNAWMATGGFVVMAAPSFYISAGGGYCSRERLKEFHTRDRRDAEPQGDVWARNIEKGTFDGLALDLDGTFRIGKVLYGSLGCTVLDLKYISGNAGIGVFF
ncbi:MAG: hypothetical protein LBH77_01660 [Tannerella sp.]|nr:hypothetical protein [Tannerella sp.]